MKNSNRVKFIRKLSVSLPSLKHSLLSKGDIPEPADSYGDERDNAAVGRSFTRKLSVILSPAPLLFGLILATALSSFAQPQGGFLPITNGHVQGLIEQPDGKILALVGNDNNAAPRRYNPDGTLDASFVPSNGVLRGDAIALDTQGLIYCGGNQAIQRLNGSGTIDNSFSPPLIGGNAKRIAIAGDGRVYIAGQFSTVNGMTQANIARLNTNGSIDASFGNSLADGRFESILLESNGQILVGGTFANVGGGPLKGIARLNNDGTRDMSFTPPNFGGQGFVFTIAKQSDGKYIVAGSFTVTAGQELHTNIVRLNADGSHDPSFRLAEEDRPKRTIFAVAVHANGQISIGRATRSFAPFGPEDYFVNLVGRFNASGSRANISQQLFLDKQLIETTDVYALTLQSDGKLLVGGNYRYAAVATPNTTFGKGFSELARMKANGLIDAPFARFDFDGDDRADFSVFRPSNKTWYYHTGTVYSSFVFAEATDRPAPADYDGDGKTDIAVFRGSNGTWYWINSATITFSYLQWGENGDLPIPGTRYGRRQAIFDVYRPSNGTWYRLQIDNGIGTFRVKQFPGSSEIASSIPIPGDYKPYPSGSSDPFYTTSLAVYIRSSNQLATTDWYAAAFGNGRVIGQTGDVPVSLDHDGDHQSDWAIYRPTTGEWKIIPSTNAAADNSPITYTWGEPGDIPVPADYDGDQRDDIAVYRPSTGTWYIIGSTEGWQIRQFGESGDIPLPSSYLYGLP